MQPDNFLSTAPDHQTVSDQDQRPMIACIDDSKTVQRQVKLVLEAAGFRVLGINEPARALTALVRHRPVLVLMDITMPEVDGYQLCRMLRRSQALAEVPILMLTGKDGVVDRIRARGVGATDYLTKPVHPQELLSRVQKLLAAPATPKGGNPQLAPTAPAAPAQPQAPTPSLIPAAAAHAPEAEPVGDRVRKPSLKDLLKQHSQQLLTQSQTHQVFCQS